MPETRERLCQVWLSCADSLGPKGRKRLTDYYQGAEQAYDNFSAKAQDLVGPKAYQELQELRLAGLDRLKLALDRSHINICALSDPDYPEGLRQIEDAPPLLFYKGTLPGKDQPAIAIVGSRRETRYGRDCAFSIARDLGSAGVVVVSGLARGIDTAAHQGALHAGGVTLGILGSGIQQIYPRENEDLARNIVEQGGAIISEFAPKAEPLAFRFPYRNRVVAGLSQAVLLVEAREKSGTLITVGHALQQGKEVFAIPGQIDAPGSLIPHQMLRDGARLVTSGEDILEDMGWLQSPSKKTGQLSFAPPADLTKDERRLYDALQDEAKDPARLMEELSLSISEVNVLLTTMEMNGLIQALPGRQFKRNHP